MSKKDEQICPICKKPVGNDPHEACYEIARGRLAEHEAGMGPDDETFPCPQCGSPLNEHGSCTNEECPSYAESH